MKGSTLMQIKKKEKFIDYLWKHKSLYIMLIPMFLHLFCFCYLPMFGITLAFREYMPGDPIMPWAKGIKWVGLKYLKNFFSSVYAGRIFRNTIVLSLLNIAFGFWVPILFALMLNEIKNKYYKKVTQTISYLPHFISSAIVAGILTAFLSPNEGIINQIVVAMGGKAEHYLAEPAYFRPIYVTVCIWQSFGWNSILYLANIASIPQELYESVKVDGGGRWCQMWHVTVQGIKPTMFVLFIFSVGGILNSDMEKIYLLLNSSNLSVADVLGTFIYRTGILGAQYSSATMMGLFTSIIGFILVYTSNKITGRMTGYGIW